MFKNRDKETELGVLFGTHAPSEMDEHYIVTEKQNDHLLYNYVIISTMYNKNTKLFAVQMHQTLGLYGHIQEHNL